MDGWELAVLLKLQYPQFYAMLDKPGVFDVLQQALGADVPWTQDRLDAALANTPYFLNTPKEYRDLDIANALDPASGMEKYKGAQLAYRDLSYQLGVKLNGELAFDPFTPNINLWGQQTDYDSFIRDSIAMGWNTQEMKYALLVRANAKPGQAIGGEVGTNMAKVMKMADDYGVPLGQDAHYYWGSQLTSGMIDENGIKGYLTQQAKSLYPGITDALDRGITVRQYADPYLQIAQQELGIDPNTVSLTDSKWNRALNQVDAKTGQRVSMSLADWTAAVRSGPEYGYDKTVQGRTKGAQLSTAIANMMGGLG